MAATMIVDGREIEINGEKNVLEVIRKAGGGSSPPSVITLSFQFMEPAACAWWKMIRVAYTLLVFSLRLRA